jgi:hypothetical protein
MATAAVSTSSTLQQLQDYVQQRQTDLQLLDQALQTGDLAVAQQEFTTIQNAAQNGPLDNGNAFQNNQRQQDFAALGQALQAGDLAGAQQAFSQLQSTFRGGGGNGLAPNAPGIAGGGTGPEVILNLGNITPGEQITIGVNNAANGGEQLTIGIANQQNQNPEQITLNLNANSNGQLILNLFNNTAENSPQGTALNIAA